MSDLQASFFSVATESLSGLNQTRISLMSLKIGNISTWLCSLSLYILDFKQKWFPSGTWCSDDRSQGKKKKKKESWSCSQKHIETLDISHTYPSGKRKTHRQGQQWGMTKTDCEKLLHRKNNRRKLYSGSQSALNSYATSTWKYTLSLWTELRKFHAITIWGSKSGDF
jgi:hypothetical protein